MIYLFLFVIFLFLLLLVFLFLSVRILVNSTKQDVFDSHFLELGLVFNIFRFQFVYQEKEKFIQFKCRNWKIFAKHLDEKKPKKVKEKKIKPEKKDSFGKRLKSSLKYKSLRLRVVKNHTLALIKGFKNPRIEGHLQIGFSNPMHTGMLMGSYTMLSGIWADFQKNVVFDPVFTNRMANWQLSFSTQFILARLAWRSLLIWNSFRKIK